ncbi:hypothetical protein QBC47DRAFT_373786 [Echria macrotheca]|uniref:Uncharacterized protein n=1 Tax=Echria macrotheca TaxID=438768 RepID=A0AAJ0BH27_9PEZI|nr:hypothetical protein QBC47DRAFT_373786 [Echria macrotheca]
MFLGLRLTRVTANLVHSWEYSAIRWPMPSNSRRNAPSTLAINSTTNSLSPLPSRLPSETLGGVEEHPPIRMTPPLRWTESVWEIPAIGLPRPDAKSTVFTCRCHLSTVPTLRLTLLVGRWMKFASVENHGNIARCNRPEPCHAQRFSWHTAVLNRQSQMLHGMACRRSAAILSPLLLKKVRGRGSIAGACDPSSRSGCLPHSDQRQRLAAALGGDNGEGRVSLVADSFLKQFANGSDGRPVPGKG